MSASDRYEKPALTVDVVVVAPVAGKHKVLLIRRKRPPFEGRWAIPGGLVDPHQPLEAAVRRELLEETGLEPACLQRLHYFGFPGPRLPRRHRPGLDHRRGAASVAGNGLTTPVQRGTMLAVMH